MLFTRTDNSRRHAVPTLHLVPDQPTEDTITPSTTGPEERADRNKAGTRRDVSWASSKGVQASMRANRGRDTGPELALRRAVHALGLRYRVSVRPLPEVRRTADLVFTRARVAVFMDGCFWHGCPVHHTSAATNAAFWAEKVQTTRRRDQDTDRRLTDAGWLPMRIWEHEDPREAARDVAAVVRRRRSASK
jgi:DNA mismatch endonuclease (patch repair protein)